MRLPCKSLEAKACAGRPIKKRIKIISQTPGAEFPPLPTGSRNPYALSPAARLRRSYYTGADRLCVEKGEVSQILRNCRELYNRGAGQAHSRSEMVKKLIDHLQTQFTINSATVGEMIRMRAKEQLRAEVEHMKTATIEDIANEVEAATRQKKAVGKRQPKYTFIESVEHDIMNARTNPDDVNAILSSPTDRMEFDTKSKAPGYTVDSRGRVVDVQKMGKTFTMGIGVCIREADSLKAKVDAMAEDKDTRKSLIIRFEKALTDGNIKEVCAILDKDHSLINYRFSVSELSNKIMG